MKSCVGNKGKPPACSFPSQTNMYRSLRRPCGKSYYTIHYMRKCRAVNLPCGCGMFSHKIYVYRQCFEMKDVKCLWFCDVRVLTSSIAAREKSDNESTTIKAICRLLRPFWHHEKVSWFWPNRNQNRNFQVCTGTNKLISSLRYRFVCSHFLTKCQALLYTIVIFHQVPSSFETEPSTSTQ